LERSRAQLELLTPRERAVVQLAAEDLQVVGIARQLGVSPATVRTHLGNVYVKLGVRTRSGAVAKSMRYGLIT
jgi:DNA-binding CsgD family transcriptional regulator